MEYMVTTGNLISATGLDLMQATGFTIVADKLNFVRYGKSFTINQNSSSYFFIFFFSVHCC